MMKHSFIRPGSKSCLRVQFPVFSSLQHDVNIGQKDTKGRESYSFGDVGESWKDAFEGDDWRTTIQAGSHL